MVDHTMKRLGITSCVARFLVEASGFCRMDGMVAGEGSTNQLQQDTTAGGNSPPRTDPPSDSELQWSSTRAFLLAYSRPPHDEEIRAASHLIETHGLRAFCRAILNTNEFIYLK